MDLDTTQIEGHIVPVVFWTPELWFSAEVSLCHRLVVHVDVCRSLPHVIIKHHPSSSTCSPTAINSHSLHCCLCLTDFITGRHIPFSPWWNIPLGTLAAEASFPAFSLRGGLHRGVSCNLGSEPR